MQPPRNLDVVDSHNGFTMLNRKGDTLWRPASVLRSTVGTLVEVDETSFFQTNNDVTRATYKVPGYGYPVICWFDNASGERIA